MIYVKYMPGHSLAFASRNKRELQAAQEAGYTIKVVSSDEESEFEKNFPGYELVKDRMIKLNYGMSHIRRYMLILYNILASMKAIRKTSGDVISCHNIDALCKCYLTLFFKAKKPSLIYDSHEFEIGRNKKRNRFQLWFITHMEGFLMKRCAFSIMVNDAIADEVQRIHKLEERPIVVRNIPTLWNVDSDVCVHKRKEILSKMKTPRNFILMYHGGVMSGRGIETLLELVSKNSNVCAVILGNGEEKYQKSLRMLADNLGITERVVFLPAVPIEKLWKYAGAADVGMILAPAVVKNHLYSLPNKFFENIQSETPVICPEYPAMKPIVDRYQIGLTCDPTNIESINSCVERLRTDKTFYQKCVENTRKAKQELCWEKEKKVLLESLENVYD